MVDALQTNFTAEYQKQAWTQWTVAGKTTGQYKSAGSFTYLRVYGAGHEVGPPVYLPSSGLRAYMLLIRCLPIPMEGSLSVKRRCRSSLRLWLGRHLCLHNLLSFHVD